MDDAVVAGEFSDQMASGIEGWGEGQSDGKLLAPPSCCCCGLVEAGEWSMLTSWKPCWPCIDHSEACEIGVTLTLGRRDFPALWDGL